MAINFQVNNEGDKEVWVLLSGPGLRYHGPTGCSPGVTNVYTAHDGLVGAHGEWYIWLWKSQAGAIAGVSVMVAEILNGTPDPGGVGSYDNAQGDMSDNTTCQWQLRGDGYDGYPGFGDPTYTD